MDKKIVDAINATPYQAFVTVTGGGQNFIGEFLAYEGGSKTILGFYVPYKQELFNAFAHGKPDNYASPEAARKLAVASYKEALKLVGPDLAIGIGAASSVAAANERVGRQHRLNVALQMKDKTIVASYVLNQGRTRAEENEMISRTILQHLACACGVDFELIPPAFKVREEEGEQYFIKSRMADEATESLVHGERNFVSEFDITDLNKIVLFCGSFNPFHKAHGEICRIAERATEQKPFIEISVVNTDKPFLDYIEIANRVADVKQHGERVLLTNAARYVDKINVLKRAGVKEIVFVVGFDTWERIWDTKYGVSKVDLINIFDENKVKFVVFSRDGKGRDVKANEELSWGDEDRFVIPCKEAFNFDLNMSSSAIRKAQNAH